MGRKAAHKVSVACLSAFLIAGCSTTIKPIDFDAASLDAHRTLMNDIQTNEPVLKPISLYEAMARALVYNLDEKIEQKDEEFRYRQHLVTRTGMWPSLLATFGVNSRSNDSGSSSRSLETDRESLEPSTSTERTYYNADLTTSWNLLDFGVAYAETQQDLTEESIAVERRRKVVNRIIESVRTTYWRAVSAERTYKKLLELESLAQRALYQATQLELTRKVPLLTTLEYQRELLTVQTNVQELQRELILAKYQLATLINLSPKTRFTLEIPSRTDVVPVLPGSARQMVRYGLIYRPELREIFYQKEINQYKKDASFYESLPGLNFILGTNYNSNKYLANDQWANLSANVSWNLVSLFRYPLQKDALEAESEVILARQQAMVMAIVTQIHVARARFIRISQELNTIRKNHDVQSRIVALTEAGYRTKQISQRQLVVEKMNEILDEISYDSAYADLQNAYASLYASMGLANLNITISDDADIEELTQKLKEHWTQRALVLPELGV
ncbi:TolC family protein [Marinomonas sp. TW1]|uniref:TolC family protein n=1 Tax=Marinomonas sp. TW1 TaxID=1561203 RepID=UPI0007AF6AA0|nr:TolC family protein [Marinomonas sp. TW1]